MAFSALLVGERLTHENGRGLATLAGNQLSLELDRVALGTAVENTVCRFYCRRTSGQTLAQAAGAASRSVLRGPFRSNDDEFLNRTLRGLESQTQLALERSKDRRN